MDEEANNIICVLDALDECQSPGREKLVDKLNDLYHGFDTEDVQEPFLRFMATSRPYREIESAFSPCTIRLTGEDESESISKEINMVIEVKVDELAARLGLGPSREWFEDDLKRHLLAIPHRTYLWLHLILETILHRRGALAGGLTRLRLKIVIEELFRSVADI